MTRYLVTATQAGFICAEMNEAGIVPHSEVKLFPDWGKMAEWLSRLGISEAQLTEALGEIGEGKNAILSVLQ